MSTFDPSEPDGIVERVGLVCNVLLWLLGPLGVAVWLVVDVFPAWWSDGTATTAALLVAPAVWFPMYHYVQQSTRRCSDRPPRPDPISRFFEKVGVAVYIGFLLMGALLIARGLLTWTPLNLLRVTTFAIATFVWFALGHYLLNSHRRSVRFQRERDGGEDLLRPHPTGRLTKRTSWVVWTLAALAGLTECAWLFVVPEKTTLLTEVPPLLQGHWEQIDWFDRGQEEPSAMVVQGGAIDWRAFIEEGFGPACDVRGVMLVDAEKSLVPGRFVEPSESLKGRVYCEEDLYNPTHLEFGLRWDGEHLWIQGYKFYDLLGGPNADGGYYAVGPEGEFVRR